MGIQSAEFLHGGLRLDLFDIDLFDIDLGVTSLPNFYLNNQNWEGMLGRITNYHGLTMPTKSIVKPP